MDQNDMRKELLNLLSQRGLSRDELLSVSVAVARPEHTLAMISFLKEEKELTVDEVFQKAGEIAFGKNS